MCYFLRLNKYNRKFKQDFSQLYLIFRKFILLFRHVW